MKFLKRQNCRKDQAENTSPNGKDCPRRMQGGEGKNHFAEYFPAFMGDLLV